MEEQVQHMSHEFNNFVKLSQIYFVKVDFNVFKYLGAVVCAHLRRMLKEPPLKSSDLHFSVLKCHCQTYDDIIGHIRFF